MSKVEQIKNLLTALEFELITKEEFDKRLPTVLNLPKDTKDDNRR